jgi:glycosyltransferase involved in cell wall biosynthesis
MTGSPQVEESCVAGVARAVRPASAETGGLPFVSVVVPVWNDAARLSRCLDALEAQTYPAHLYEVVVVDNGSADALASAVAQRARCRVVVETRPGSYAARNAVERYEMLYSLAQSNYVSRYGFGATANLFAFREVFERAGPFLAEVKSSGDLEWCRRATARGYRLEYADDVRVSHPARSTLAELHAKMVRTAGGLHDLKRIKGRGYLEFERGLLLEFLPPVRAAARLLREPALRGARERLKVCSVLFFVRYAQAVEKLRLSFPKPWSRRSAAR